MRSYINGLAILVLMGACRAGGEDPGREYAPNMYHSIAYEPLKQIKDKSAGLWVNSSEQNIGEYYSSNPNNPSEMNMRLPVANTIPRRRFNSVGTDVYFVAGRIHKDSLAQSARELKNPFPEGDPQVLADGKNLYVIYCAHCHGKTGSADGKVAPMYTGVPKYSSRAIKNAPEGHLFHVITHGKGRMWPHGSQIAPDERWKIVRYVQVLQKGAS
jgi:cytochrome c5